MEKANIILIDAHHQLLHDVVASGEYATVSEVIRDALAEWERNRRVREEEIGALKQQIAEGLEDFHAGRFHAWNPEATKASIAGKA
ncbi:MAG: type II toxin-antitoxin system ParD family antitoxin [Blastomonas sp.]|jgi:antitoxin ParD1/3/4